MIIAKKVREILQKNPVQIDHGIKVPISASVGIATYIPGQYEFSSAEHLMDAADKTMYQAKKNGRDQALIFNETHLYR